MSLAFIFPGQGSQAVGMGAELAEAFAAAREVFQEVDDALGQKLSKLMREGPIEDADPDRERPAGADGGQPGGGAHAGEASSASASTRRPSSPAIRWANIPRWPRPARSALADTARLLKLRGQAMQRAVPVGEGAMASLIGPKTDVALAEAAAAAGAEVGVCVVANDNNAGNVVISGAKAAVDRAIEKAKELGARAIPLNVSAPFHCPLMQPAADEMAEALAERHDLGAARVRWSPMSPPGRPTIRRRSAACWSSRSPAGCAGARASSGWRARAA